MSAPFQSAAAVLTTSTPASLYSASEKPAFAPAPVSIIQSYPSFWSCFALSGVMPTRFSPSNTSFGVPIFKDLPPCNKISQITGRAAQCCRLAKGHARDVQAKVATSGLNVANQTPQSKPPPNPLTILGKISTRGDAQAVFFKGNKAAFQYTYEYRDQRER